MNTIDDYLSGTESAMRSLFAGIASYTAMIGRIPVYTTWDPDPNSPAFKKWLEDNAEEIKASFERHRQFTASAFAMATLCGAVLQVADKAIELYSANTTVPESVKGLLLPNKTTGAPYCIGREIRGIPIGLIYAGRNQHAHFEELPKAIGRAVFERLAHPGGQYDPSFDLHNDRLVNYAHNITGLLQWRSYEAYLADMQQLPLTKIHNDPPASPQAS